MNNDLKSANSAKIGKRFYESRVRLNYSVNEVADILFINKDYISAIEDGNYAVFPSKAFAHAYFKKYKDFLDIECEFPNIFDEKNDKKFKKIKKEIKLSYSIDKNVKKYVLVSLLTASALTLTYFKNSKSSEVIDSKIFSKELKISDLEKIEALIKDNILSKKINMNNVKKKPLLLLFFEASSWVEIYKDNVLIEVKQFDKGDSYELVIDIPFKVVVGNADSVKGTYNGDLIEFNENASGFNGVKIIDFNNE